MKFNSLKKFYNLFWESDFFNLIYLSVSSLGTSSMQAKRGGFLRKQREDSIKHKDVQRVGIKIPVCFRND